MSAATYIHNKPSTLHTQDAQYAEIRLAPYLDALPEERQDRFAQVVFDICTRAGVDCFGVTDAICVPPAFVHEIRWAVRGAFAAFMPLA